MTYASRATNSKRSWKDRSSARKPKARRPPTLLSPRRVPQQRRRANPHHYPMMRKRVLLPARRATSSRGCSRRCGKSRGDRRTGTGRPRNRHRLTGTRTIAQPRAAPLFSSKIRKRNVSGCVRPMIAPAASARAGERHGRGHFYHLPENVQHNAARIILDYATALRERTGARIAALLFLPACAGRAKRHRAASRLSHPTYSITSNSAGHPEPSASRGQIATLRSRSEGQPCCRS